MAKRRISHMLHEGLNDRLNAERVKQDRTLVSIIEQALAEYLNVPLADRELPEQAVELCPRCERGVLNNGRCAECRWRRDPRASLDEAKRSAHAAVVRARVQPGSEYPKEEAA